MGCVEVEGVVWDMCGGGGYCVGCVEVEGVVGMCGGGGCCVGCMEVEVVGRMEVEVVVGCVVV